MKNAGSSMNNRDKEMLSQLMDGEWQDLNAASSVKAACADDQLKSTWSRYHLIRDVIRNDEIRVDTGLTERISQAIADEPTYTNVSPIGLADTSASTSDQQTSDNIHELNNDAKPRQSNGWRTAFGGLAIAASVALATVLGMNVWQGAPNSGSNAQTVASNPAVQVPGVVLPEVEFVSNKGTYWVTPEEKRSAAAEKRLNMLLSAHIERSPTAERTGMLPYSRLVGYDSVTSE